MFTSPVPQRAAVLEPPPSSVKSSGAQSPAASQKPATGGLRKPSRVGAVSGHHEPPQGRDGRRASISTGSPTTAEVVGSSPRRASPVGVHGVRATSVFLPDIQFQDDRQRELYDVARGAEASVPRNVRRPGASSEAVITVAMQKAKALGAVALGLASAVDYRSSDETAYLHASTAQQEIGLQREAMATTMDPARRSHAAQLAPEALEEKYFSNFEDIKDILVDDAPYGEEEDEALETQLLHQNVARIRAAVKATYVNHNKFGSSSRGERLKGDEELLSLGDRRGPILEAYRRAMRGELQKNRESKEDHQPMDTAISGMVLQDKQRRLEIKRIVDDADHPSKLVPILWSLCDTLQKQEARLLYAYLHMERLNVRAGVISSQLQDVRRDTAAGLLGDVRKMQDDIEFFESERDWLYKKIKIFELRCANPGDDRDVVQQYVQRLEEECGKLRTKGMSVRMQTADLRLKTKRMEAIFPKYEQQLMQMSETQVKTEQLLDQTRKKYLTQLDQGGGESSDTAKQAAELERVLASRRHYMLKNSIILRVSLERLRNEKGKFIDDVLKQSGVGRMSDSARDQFIRFVGAGHDAVLTTVSDFYQSAVEDVAPFIDVDLATRWTQHEDPIIVLLAQRLTLPNPYALYAAAADVLKQNWVTLAKVFALNGKGIFDDYIHLQRENTELNSRDVASKAEIERCYDKINDLMLQLASCRDSLRRMSEGGLRGEALTRAVNKVLEQQAEAEQENDPPEEEVPLIDATSSDAKMWMERYNGVVLRFNKLQTRESDKTRRIIEVEGACRVLDKQCTEVASANKELEEEVASLREQLAALHAGGGSSAGSPTSRRGGTKGPKSATFDSVSLARSTSDAASRKGVARGHKRGSFSSAVGSLLDVGDFKGFPESSSGTVTPLPLPATAGDMGVVPADSPAKLHTPSRPREQNGSPAGDAKNKQPVNADLNAFSPPRDVQTPSTPSISHPSTGMVADRKAVEGLEKNKSPLPATTTQAHRSDAPSEGLTPGNGHTAAHREENAANISAESVFATFDTAQRGTEAGMTASQPIMPPERACVSQETQTFSASKEDASSQVAPSPPPQVRDGSTSTVPPPQLVDHCIGSDDASCISLEVADHATWVTRSISTSPIQQFDAAAQASVMLEKALADAGTAMVEVQSRFTSLMADASAQNDAPQAVTVGTHPMSVLGESIDEASARISVACDAHSALVASWLSNAASSRLSPIENQSSTTSMPAGCAIHTGGRVLMEHHSRLGSAGRRPPSSSSHSIRRRPDLPLAVRSVGVGTDVDFAPRTSLFSSGSSTVDCLDEVLGSNSASRPHSGAQAGTAAAISRSPPLVPPAQLAVAASPIAASAASSPLLLPTGAGFEMQVFPGLVTDDVLGKSLNDSSVTQVEAPTPILEVSASGRKSFRTTLPATSASDAQGTLAVTQQPSVSPSEVGGRCNLTPSTKSSGEALHDAEQPGPLKEARAGTVTLDRRKHKAINSQGEATASKMPDSASVPALEVGPLHDDDEAGFWPGDPQLQHAAVPVARVTLRGRAFTEAGDDSVCFADDAPSGYRLPYSQMCLAILALHRSLEQLFNLLIDLFHVPFTYEEPPMATELYHALRLSSIQTPMALSVVGRFCSSSLILDRSLVVRISSFIEKRLQEMRTTSANSMGGAAQVSMLKQDSALPAAFHLGLTMSDRMEAPTKHFRSSGCGDSLANDDAPALFSRHSLRNLREGVAVGRRAQTVHATVGVTDVRHHPKLIDSLPAVENSPSRPHTIPTTAMHSRRRANGTPVSFNLPPRPASQQSGSHRRIERPAVDLHPEVKSVLRRSDSR